MTTDLRVIEYRRAAEQMRLGRFDVDIHPDGRDEVARLGESLQALAENLETRFDEVAKLTIIAERVNAGLVLADILDGVYDSFRSVIPYDRIGLALLEDEGKMVKARWAKADSGEIKLGVGYTAPIAGSSLREILRSGRPRILNDLETYLKQHPDSESTRLIVAEGIRSSLTCPLAALGKPIGFLFFSSRAKNTYRELHQGYFMQLAGQISVILEKSRLYEELLSLNQQLQEMQTALQHEASHDALTGLWNRRAVLRLLDREIARADREKKPLTAVIMDLDHFKQTNDEHGHLVGDQVLRELSRRLGATLRSSELLGRLGGEEFLIVHCPSDASTARKVMERVRAAIAEQPFSTSAGELDITVSLGAATAVESARLEMSALLNVADQALYTAKSDGRNRWQLELIEPVE